MHKCAEYIGCSGKDISIYSEDDDLKFEQCNECEIIWRSSDSMHLLKPYEQTYFESKSYSKRRKHKVKKSGWLIDLARIKNPKINRLLEIGCSIGYTLEAAKNRKIKHLGIDISEYAVNYCNNLGLNASSASFDELKKTNNKFDLIFMQHVLEHFENPFAVLKDCHELLNENGIVLILVPNSKYIRAVKQNSKHRFYSKSGVGLEHFVYFNYKNLSKTLEASGFKVIQKNYPILMSKYDSFTFFMNRIFRRSLRTFNNDQELLVIARKI
jgi:2-polyprenyl-3-methyl-5-hydroxy-6-metoxy-1,4-benzoquinol methylase